jgi:hypothetical protein
MASELEGMTVAELKDLLRERGQPVSGNKSVLIQRLEEYDSEEIEEKIEFNCNNCKSRLRIPRSFQGLVTCPACSTKQSTSEVDNTSGPISIDITQNQISLAISITGIVLGILAIVVFFSAFTMDSMCPEEYRSTIMVDGEEAILCDSDEMLWETEMAKRVFYSCCLMVPGSLFLTIMGYSLRKEQRDIGTATIEKEATTHSNNFSDSKVAKAIQVAAVSFGIGISTITAILAIVVIVLFGIVIYAIFSSGGGFFA